MRGEKSQEAIAETDYDYGTLVHASSAAKRIELGRRRPNLSFSHHQEVAKFTPDIQSQPRSLTMTRATYPDSERTSALARASSFARLSNPKGRLISYGSGFRPRWLVRSTGLPFLRSSMTRTDTNWATERPSAAARVA